MNEQNSHRCIFTIASKNYLAHARVLSRSIAQYHPNMKIYLFLADVVDGFFNPRQEPFTEVIEARSVGIPQFESFAFKYNILELNTAIKPFCFDYLFTRKEFSQVLYLDPDMKIFSSLDMIFQLLESHLIVLTPHITNPLPSDKKLGREINLIKVGCYNLGFCGISRRNGFDRLVGWWKSRLQDECIQAPLSPYGVDQVWMNIIPCFVDTYFILKHPGVNIAYWNLHERTVEKRGDSFFVNGEPLIIFHYSGFDVRSPQRISRYQSSSGSDSCRPLGDLLALYQKLLLDNGHVEAKKMPCHYNYFSNGAAIGEVVRGIYWGLNNYGRFPEPFTHFYRQLLQPSNIRRLFSERFLRAMFQKFVLLLWKRSLKRKRKEGT
ncbi:MAG: hypothetical protein JW795_09345 [Chitinivibrionales bacterium]|nr:hypothetical protein [Chitinivibrionales bacterium]